MKSETVWKTDYDNEISRAISAREMGNEGMARVCARRAAGIVIGEYLFRRGYYNLNASVYDRLALFISLPDVDERAKSISNHFIMKVDYAHNLPVDADLISDVQWLAGHLLPENTN